MIVVSVIEVYLTVVFSYFLLHSIADLLLFDG
jgi:hypothetical protein